MKELIGGGGQPKPAARYREWIAAKVMEVTSAQGKGRIWIAQNGGFPVKIVVTGADGKAVTLIEMKQLSLAKPPASAFALRPVAPRPRSNPRPAKSPALTSPP